MTRQPVWPDDQSSAKGGIVPRRVSISGNRLKICKVKHPPSHDSLFDKPKGEAIPAYGRTTTRAIRGIKTMPIPTRPLDAVCPCVRFTSSRVPNWWKLKEIALPLADAAGARLGKRRRYSARRRFGRLALHAPDKPRPPRAAEDAPSSGSKQGARRPPKHRGVQVRIAFSPRKWTCKISTILLLGRGRGTRSFPL